mmetsp:Transcript_1244/g.2372  ORF Transcript_1244/g.2372 Transcript_1244/m.2372 type:complete len:110 (+) Transcript_1244:83-412(+)
MIFRRVQLATWAVHRNSLLFAMVSRRVELATWAVHLWCLQDKDYFQSMAIALTIIVPIAMATAMVFWLELRSEKKEKPKYHRKTSIASAVAVDRQFLEEAVSMKQNVIK